MKNQQGMKFEKTHYQRGLLGLFLSLSLGGSLGCNKMSFKPSEILNQSASETPIVDPVTPPTDVMPDPLRKAGACADQQSVTSCSKCVVPVDLPPAPTLSTKAQKLATIMEMACQIYNKSYPQPYVAPTHDEIYQHILACTPDIYPETPMTAGQTSLIDSLLNTKSEAMRQRLFKSLWYQVPYTDQFGLYFGLENKEAAYVFCMNQGISGPYVSTEYAQALIGDQYEAWLLDSAAQARWNAAQAQRAQLVACLNKPGVPQLPPPPPPAKKHGCEYKSFEGYYEIGGRDEIQNYIAAGFQVTVESATATTPANSCQSLNSIPNVGAYTGKVKIAGVKCH